MFTKKLEFIINGLMSLPKLNELKIDNLEDTQIKLLVLKLPKLQKINSIVLKKKKNKISEETEKIEEDNNNNKNLEKNNHLDILFNCVDFLYNEREEDYNISKKIQMDINLKNELKNLSTLITPDSSKEILECFNLKSEMEINWFILKSIISYIEKFGDTRVAKIIQAVQGRNKIISDSLFDFVETNQQLSSQLKMMKRKQKRMFLEKNNLQEKFYEMKRNLENYEEINKMERPRTQMNFERRKLHEIKKYSSNPRNEENNDNFNLSKNISKRKNENLQRLFKKGSKNNFKNEIERIKNHEENNFPKILIKNNISEMIFEAFSSKKRFDKIILESFLPFKNLKEHLEESLLNKFGLKKIVKNMMDSILISLEEYYENDVEIFIFKSILEFNLNEEFYDTFLQIKKTIRNCYYYLLMSQNPNKSKEKLLQIFDNNLENFIDLRDAYTTLVLLYKENDAKDFWIGIEKLIEFEKTEKPRLRTTEFHKPKKLLNYEKFETFVIKKITLSQIIFLEKITKIFNEFNKNKNGILTENEFIKMIERISFIINTDLDVNELLKRLDPTNTKVIGYSPCISLISTLFTSYQEKEISIISILNKKIL